MTLNSAGCDGRVSTDRAQAQPEFDWVAALTTPALHALSSQAFAALAPEQLAALTPAQAGLA